MNLYLIVFEHSAPKDTEGGIKTLVLADSDEQVYEWLKTEPETSDGTLYNNWEDKEGEEYEIYDDEYEVVGTETFKERCLRLRGELHFDDNDYSDLYYGKTYIGWELAIENTTTDYTELIAAGVVKKLN